MNLISLRYLVPVCAALSCARPTAWTAPQDSTGFLPLGRPVSTAPSVAIADLFARPTLYENRDVRVTGVILSQCSEGGCWIDIAPDPASPFRVIVFAQGRSFTFPLGCAGRTAEVYGRFTIPSVPEEKLRHWAHHGWRTDRAVHGPMRVHRIDAVHVRIR